MFPGEQVSLATSRNGNRERDQRTNWQKEGHQYNFIVKITEKKM